MRTDLIREVVFGPAGDGRSVDPKKNYGIWSADCRFHLKGTLGAVQFVLYTGWHLPHVQAELDAKPKGYSGFMAVDLGYHSPKPRYEDQTSIGTCKVLGGECYYDGSGLNAEPVLQLLLEKGSEAVWERLESYYAQVFEGGDDEA